ncbi:hypothetical protein [Lysobacter gummosus]|uniref:hypothetical protein n=1 Tax=Lysobacter gummosus TaxID=262324 RepID=UPI003640FF2F
MRRLLRGVGSHAFMIRRRPCSVCSDRVGWISVADRRASGLKALPQEIAQPRSLLRQGLQARGLPLRPRESIT